MDTYIALLRGVNISGKNKVSMPILRQAFEEAGFSQVSTYINSGNVIFSSESKDKIGLIKRCEALISETFALTIPVNVISAADLSATLANAPVWWNLDKESVNYAIFVIPPMTTEQVLTAVGSPKAEYEQIAVYDNIIFLTAPLKTYNKGRWSKIASSTVNQHVTIRNGNTTNKLLTLTKKDS